MGLKLYTGGTFDLYHSGHAAFLKRCSQIAGWNDGEVIVALNTDEFIEEYKGKPPVMSFQERKNTLLSVKYVDKVIPNYGGADSRIAIEAVMPDLIVVGSDWARKDYYTQMAFDQNWLDEREIGLCYIPYTKGISTTDIKGRFR